MSRFTSRYQQPNLTVPFIAALALLCTMSGLASVAQADDSDQPAIAPPTLKPQLGLPFQDNAILQQQIPLPVWGTTLPNASVMVTFANQVHGTTANDSGRWQITLKPLTAVKLKSVNDNPPGKTLTVTAERDGTSATTQITNVLVGEVWLCAGQSNMAGSMRTNTSRHHPADSIAIADYPAFRQLVSPSTDGWVVCTPDTAPQFKKVCFFFGRRVQQDALVPVGVINAAVGGSNIEPWLYNSPEPNGKHYQRFIEPLAKFGLRGVIWYQGESNAKDRRAYEPKLKALINGWRHAWNQPASASPGGPRKAFSFYYVQLPGIGTSPTDNPQGGDGRAEIRQAYLNTLALPNTGMAITIDIGDVREHPPNKYDTGVRLAHLALHHDYGFKKIVPSGPLYKSHKVVGATLRIQFDHAPNGLMIAEKTGFLPPTPKPDAKLGWLALQGRDGRWHWADAQIQGNELIVSAAGVTQPIAARYAYTNHPVGPLLYNAAGLPASPFTTCGYDPAPISND